MERLSTNKNSIIYRVYSKYLKYVSFNIYLFIVLRTRLLPLHVYNDEIPKEGIIVEIGSGHGIIARFLALSSSKRHVIGFDPDIKRTEIAKIVSIDEENVEFIAEYYSNQLSESIDAAIVIGVFCLMEDSDVCAVLKMLNISFSEKSLLYISDIPAYDKFDIIHLFHITREKFFGIIGFTQGDGLYLRTHKEWRGLLESSGFKVKYVKKAPVFLHRTYDIVCEKLIV